MPPTAHLDADVTVEHARPQARVEPDATPCDPRVHRAVAERRRACKPLSLPLTRGRHASAHRFGALLAACIRHEFERARRLELAHEVDAVEERSAEPALVAGPRVALALAQSLRPGARAGVACTDQHHGRREPDRALAASDLDPTRFERLP